MTRVKVCGLTRLDDAEAALEAGANALGFVFHTSSPRYVGRHAGAIDIPAALGPFALCVAVFGAVPTPPVLPTGIAAVQGEFDDSLFFSGRRIRTLRPREGIEFEWHNFQGCDAVVLDAYDPVQSGGTGRTIDWNIAAEIVRVSPVPVVLAGGLTPDNVGPAIRMVRPYAVDVASGVESSPGIKDHAKLRDFMQAVRS